MSTEKITNHCQACGSKKDEELKEVNDHSRMWMVCSKCYEDLEDCVLDAATRFFKGKTRFRNPNYEANTYE